MTDTKAVFSGNHSAVLAPVATLKKKIRGLSSSNTPAMYTDMSLTLAVRAVTTIIAARSPSTVNEKHARRLQGYLNECGKARISTRNRAKWPNAGIRYYRLPASARRTFQSTNDCASYCSNHRRNESETVMETFRIRPKRAYRHTNQPSRDALDPSETYSAVWATNQPNWRENGTIFVESQGGWPELSLDSDEYEIVSE